MSDFKGIKREVVVHPTVQEIAAFFCDLFCEDQALFFVLVAAEFESWGKMDRNTQALSIYKHIKDLSAQELLKDFCDYDRGEIK